MDRRRETGAEIWLARNGGSAVRGNSRKRVPLETSALRRARRAFARRCPLTTPPGIGGGTRQETGNVVRRIWSEAEGLPGLDPFAHPRGRIIPPEIVTAWRRPTGAPGGGSSLRVELGPLGVVKSNLSRELDPHFRGIIFKTFAF